jgi:hypothetical protein
MYELRLGDAKDQWIVTAVDEKQRQELAQYVTETENKLKAAASPPATPPPTPPAPAT